MNRENVVVIKGGPSSEAEVSRASSAAVARALRATGYAVEELDLEVASIVKLCKTHPDVVFPVVHGAMGEDGALQGLLELLGIPYVASGILASALAMNKPVAKRFFASAGLVTAPEICLPRGDANVQASLVRENLPGAVVVKPASNGSAIGVARVPADAAVAELAKALKQAWEVDPVALVEHWVRGKEVTCGVLDLDDGGPVALPPTEIESPYDEFYTYEARYAPGRSIHHCPARFPDDVLQAIRKAAVVAHTSLGCRDFSRVDFVVGDGANLERVTVLEVNTIPGFTGTSLLPEAAAVSGLGFEALCDRLVRKALARGATQTNRPLAFPGSPDAS